MQLSAARLARTIRQFRVRALQWAGIASLAGIAIAGLLDPVTTREGAILLGVSASILASLIVAAVALERNEFADELLGLGIDQVFKDRLRDIPSEYWTELLAGVDQHFRVLGMANHGYLNSDPAKQETARALRRALKRKKVTVELLWLNPDTEIASVREREEGRRGLRRDTCAAVVFFAELAKELPPDQLERLSLREYQSLPTCGITWADDRLVVTHYLAGELNQRAPGVVLDTTEPLLRRAATAIRKREPQVPALAQAYINNYREVASDAWSRPIDDERVETLRQLRDTLTEEQPDKRSEAELRIEDGQPDGD